MLGLGIGIIFLLIGFLAIYSIAISTIAILEVIGFWKTYKKMGFEGWESIIPFYNSFVLYKCVWGNGWFFLLELIPIGGIIAKMITLFQLAKRFNKSSGFGIGLMLIPWLFIFILGIEKDKVVQRNVRSEDGTYTLTEETIYAAKYDGPKNNGKSAMIISSAIVGGVSIILSILLGVMAALFAVNLGSKFIDSLTKDKNGIIIKDYDDDFINDDFDDSDWINGDINEKEIEELVDNILDGIFDETGIDNPIKSSENVF